MDSSASMVTNSLKILLVDLLNRSKQLKVILHSKAYLMNAHRIQFLWNTEHFHFHISPEDIVNMFSLNTRSLQEPSITYEPRFNHQLFQHFSYCSTVWTSSTRIDTCTETIKLRRSIWSSFCNLSQNSITSQPPKKNIIFLRTSLVSILETALRHLFSEAFSHKMTTKN